MIFTLIGLCVLTLCFGWIGLVGIASIAYNPTGSVSQRIMGALAIIAAIASTYWLWHSFAPIKLVAA